MAKAMKNHISWLFLLALAAASGIVVGNLNLASPKSVEAHTLEDCRDSASYGSSKVSGVARMEHDWGTFIGKAKGRPSATGCATAWAATNVDDVALDTWVYHESSPGSFSVCAVTHPGWRGSNPGFGEWYESYNYYGLQDCDEGNARKGETLAKGRWNDDTVKEVMAFSGEHE